MGPDLTAQLRPLEDVRAFYRTNEEIILTSLPAGTLRVVARRARGDLVEAQLGREASFDGLEGGTYSFEALAADGTLLAEELTTVGTHAGERPVHGFATSFDDGALPAVLDWLRELRCTVVQIYDWMHTYTEPLGPSRDGEISPGGRFPSRLCVLLRLAFAREGLWPTLTRRCTRPTQISPLNTPRCCCTRATGRYSVFLTC